MQYRVLIVNNCRFTFLKRTNSFFKGFFIYFYFQRERGREGERDGEKHQCVVASHMHPTGDLAHNSGMCPEWQSNGWPFGSQADTQSTEPHQPELIYVNLKESHKTDCFLTLKQNSNRSSKCIPYLPPPPPLPPYIHTHSCIYTHSYTFLHTHTHECVSTECICIPTLLNLTLNSGERVA